MPVAKNLDSTQWAQAQRVDFRFRYIQDNVFEGHIDQSVGVHGIGGLSSVVGTADTQTLTNKTIGDTLTMTTGEFDSLQSSTSPAFTFDATDSGLTGPLVEVQDVGTWVARINNAGNLVMASGNGLIAAFGLDETTYPDHFCNFRNTFSGTQSAHKAAVYVRANAQNSNNASSWDTYGGQFETYHFPGSGSGLGGVYGIRGLAYSSATASGTTLGNLAGMRFITQCVGSTAQTVTTMAGMWASMQPTGSNKTIQQMYGMYCAAPSAPGGSTTITTAYGVYVQDQGGHASTNNAAIRVDTQSTNAGATQGNLWFQSGNWDEGHVQLNTAHVWADDDVVLRGKHSAPTSDTDGAIIAGALVEATTTYSVAVGVETVICNSASDFTVTLPAVEANRVVRVKNTNTGVVTVAPASTEAIDDDVTDPVTLVQYAAIEFRCDGTEWWIF